ncbi:hypothetical protein [Streptomyces sp. NPDC006368]|uniref:hypothetical protein n=1 Tax=Streptomyces sp. NPDC006368 TaxID=3156760 RepID=UPI0033AC2F09
MGERDLPLAKAWVRHPAAEVHVLGQPRFDALAALSHGRFQPGLHDMPAPDRQAIARTWLDSSNR